MGTGVGRTSGGTGTVSRSTIARGAQLAELNALRARLIGRVLHAARKARRGRSSRHPAVCARCTTSCSRWTRRGAWPTARPRTRPAGRLPLADEYRQLWEILVSAMEQFGMGMRGYAADGGAVCEAVPSGAGRIRRGYDTVFDSTVRPAGQYRTRMRGKREIR